jgi:hypothetical protein
MALHDRRGLMWQTRGGTKPVVTNGLLQMGRYKSTGSKIGQILGIRFAVADFIFAHLIIEAAQ